MILGCDATLLSQGMASRLLRVPSLFCYDLITQPSVSSCQRKPIRGVTARYIWSHGVVWLSLLCWAVLQDGASLFLPEEKEGMSDWKILLSKLEQAFWGKMLKSLFREKALQLHSGSGVKPPRSVNDS